MPDETHATTNGSRPLIRLDEGGTAPVLSYDVPQPAEYTGRNYIELEFDDDIWTDAASERPDPIDQPEPGDNGGGSGSPRLPQPPFEFAPDEWIRFVWGDGPVPIDPDGGVVDPEGPFVLDEAHDVPMDLALADEDRQRLGEVLLSEPMLETVLEESPESLPLFLGALSDAGPTESDPSAHEDLTAKETTHALSLAVDDDATADSGLDVVQMAVDPAYGDLFERYGTGFVLDRIDEGWTIHEHMSFSGKTSFDLDPPAAEESATPRLALVETYKLSNYLGNYGAGRTVQTFSLLPGEKHTISVNTYRNSKTTETEASSILDSYEESVADEYGEQLHSENSRTDTAEENFSYHAEAKAEASWGWGSAEVSGGVAGGTAASREEFSKNVASSTSKHAAEASSKRSVEVNTSTETSVESGRETATERVIENINLSRTLNFVFRQMNQEFISLLHLVDARVAFHNGDPRTYREVTLPELEGLLEEVVQPAERDEVRQAIWDSLFYVFDHDGEHVPFVEEHGLIDSNGDPLVDDTGDPVTYWRTVPGRTTYEENDIDVDGIVLSATTVSLPTDGIIVEALLGQGEALDAYSTDLQTETVREKAVANDAASADVERMTLARSIVAEGDDAAVGRYDRVYDDHDDDHSFGFVFDVVEEREPGQGTDRQRPARADGG